MITERIHAGLKRAKDDGKTFGRPRVSPELEQQVRAELSKGAGIIKVAKMVGVGNGTVQRIKDEMARGTVA
jgi:putative DNA-invertase from lambdoid prophage Rac